jgi:RHS repeat-associated protein
VSPSRVPLYDLGARFYAPSLGAWTSADTYAGTPADPLSLDRYLYARADPTTLRDPTGQCYVSSIDAVVPGPCPGTAASSVSHTIVRGVATKGSSTTTGSGATKTGSTVGPGSVSPSGGAVAPVATVTLPSAGLNPLTYTIGIAKGAAEGVADVGSGLANVVKDAFACMNPLLVLGGQCATANLLDAMATDPHGTESAFFLQAASQIGQARDDLLSGDPERVGRRVTAVFLIVGSMKVPIGEDAALPVGSLPREARLPQDVAVAGRDAPPVKSLFRPISRSASQNQQLWQDVRVLVARRAGDIRVNQQQVDINGLRVGINRPDLQYTLNGQRFYVEYETQSYEDALLHGPRIMANDPLGGFIPRWVP